MHQALSKSQSVAYLSPPSWSSLSPFAGSSLAANPCQFKKFVLDQSQRINSVVQLITVRLTLNCGHHTCFLLFMKDLRQQICYNPVRSLCSLHECFWRHDAFDNPSEFSGLPHDWTAVRQEGNKTSLGTTIFWITNRCIVVCREEHRFWWDGNKRIVLSIFAFNTTLFA